MYPPPARQEQSFRERRRTLYRADRSYSWWNLWVLTHIFVVKQRPRTHYSSRFFSDRCQWQLGIIPVICFQSSSIALSFTALKHNAETALVNCTFGFCSRKHWGRQIIIMIACAFWEEAGWPAIDYGTSTLARFNAVLTDSVKNYSFKSLLVSKVNAHPLL